MTAHPESGDVRRIVLLSRDGEAISPTWTSCNGSTALACDLGNSINILVSPISACVEFSWPEEFSISNGFLKIGNDLAVLAKAHPGAPSKQALIFDLMNGKVIDQLDKVTACFQEWAIGQKVIDQYEILMRYELSVEQISQL